jgi:hypothetical protein
VCACRGGVLTPQRALDIACPSAFKFFVVRVHMCSTPHQGTDLTTGYRILLTPGTYPEAVLLQYWEQRRGTQTAPVVLLAVDGWHTALFTNDVNMFNCSYVYFVGVDIIPAPAGDAFHCERCDHVVLRGMTLSGGNR